jgi:hypothetical protein
MTTETFDLGILQGTIAFRKEWLGVKYREYQEHEEHRLTQS